MVVIAPIFGYKFDLIVSTLNDLDASNKALTDPEVVDPTYGGYSGYTEAGPQPGQGYRMMPGVGSSLSSLGARILSRWAVLARVGLLVWDHDMYRYTTLTPHTTRHTSHDCTSHLIHNIF